MSAFPPQAKKCHHTGFSTPCRALIADGTCDRWKQLPGPSPFKADQKKSDWGCVDDMVWYVAGEAAMQAEAGHICTTDFREMVTNPDYRQRRLAEQEQKAIEDNTHANHDHH